MNECIYLFDHGNSGQLTKCSEGRMVLKYIQSDFRGCGSKQLKDVVTRHQIGWPHPLYLFGSTTSTIWFVHRDNQSFFLFCPRDIFVEVKLTWAICLPFVQGIPSASWDRIQAHLLSCIKIADGIWMGEWMHYLTRSWFNMPVCTLSMVHFFIWSNINMLMN